MLSYKSIQKLDYRYLLYCLNQIFQQYFLIFTITTRNIPKPNIRMDLDQNQEFFSMLECGDLAISQRIDSGIMLFGMTKRGKTTLGHFLSDEPLIGYKDGNIIYKTTIQDSQYKDAKIGNGPNSQTQIPNFFKVKSKDQQDITIIDCPGFQDTNSCYRVITNGYFTYRIFSKVKSMKFIIVIKKQDLQFEGSVFLKTMKRFFQYFNGVEDYLEDILNASCLLINRNTGQNDDNYKLLDKLRNFKPISVNRNMFNLIQKFIDHITAKRKVFSFQQAKQNTLAQKIANPLNQIIVKTNYWTRQQIKTQIDMRYIDFKLLKQIKTNQIQDQFNQQWLNLDNYFHKRVNNILSQGILQIFKSFTQDVVSANEKSCNSFALINQFSARWGNFSPLFQELRKNKKNNLFKQNNNCPSQSFWMKKIRMLDFIIIIYYQIVESHKFIQSQSQFQIQFQRVLRMIQQFKLLLGNKQQIVMVIQNYCYILFRLFEQAKMFFLLFRQEGNLTISDKIQSLSFIRILVETVSATFTLTPRQIIKNFAQNYEVKKVTKFEQCMLAINFYKQLRQDFMRQKYNQLQDQNYCRQKTQQQIQKQIQDQISILLDKQIQLYLLITGHYLQNKELIKGKSNFIKDLNKLRIQIEPLFLNSKQNKQKIQIRRNYLIQLTRSMGQLLLDLKEYEIAQHYFSSINCYEKILEINQIQIDMTKKKKTKRFLLIQMGKYAYSVGKCEIAQSKFKEARQFSETTKQQAEVQILLKQATEEGINNDKIQENIYKPLSEKAKQDIQNYLINLKEEIQKQSIINITSLRR